MKNKTFKKSISLIMAVLMVLSTWVFFVSPVEAEAATANLDGINSGQLNVNVNASAHGTFINDNDNVSAADYAVSYKNVLWATSNVDAATAYQDFAYAVGNGGASSCNVEVNWANPTTVFLYDGTGATMQTSVMYWYKPKGVNTWSVDHRIYGSFIDNSELSLVGDWKGKDSRKNFQWMFCTQGATLNATKYSTTDYNAYTSDFVFNDNDAEKIEYFSNAIKVNVTMGNTEYTRKIIPDFSSAHATQEQEYFGFSDAKSSAPLYIINYVPLKNAINEAITAYNSYKTEIANYPNRYTAESINAFVAAVNGLIEAKPNTYSYSSGAEAAVNSYASKAKAAVDAWNAAKTLKRITPDVNYDNLFSLSEWAYNTPNPGNGAIEVNNTNGSFSLSITSQGNYNEATTSGFRVEVEPNTEYTFGWTATTSSTAVTTDVYLFRNGLTTDVGSGAEQNRGTLGGGTNKEMTFNFTTLPDTNGNETTFVYVRFDVNGAVGSTATFSNIWFAKKEYADKYNLANRAKYRDLITATAFWQPTRENYTFVRWCDAENLWSWKSAPNSYTSSTTLYSDWDAINDINYDNYFSFSEWVSSDCAKVVASNKESSIDVDIPNGQFTFTPTVGYENLRLGPDNNSYYHMTLEKDEKYILQYDVSTSTGYVAIKYNDATTGLTECPDENGVAKEAFIWGGGAAGARAIAFTAPSESIWINFGTTVEDTSLLTPITFSNITVYKMSDEDKILSMGDSYEVRDLVTVGSDLSSPSRPGFSFGGWYTDRNFTSQVTNASVLGNSTTVFSKWNAIDVNYDNLFSLAGWASSKSGTVTSASKGTMSYDLTAGTITVTANDSSSDHYTAYGIPNTGHYAVKVEPGETYTIEYNVQSDEYRNQVFIFAHKSDDTAYTTIPFSKRPASNGNNKYTFTVGSDINYLTFRFGTGDTVDPAGNAITGGTATFSNIAIYKTSNNEVLESITNREYRINTPMSGADLYTPERVGYTFLGWFYDEDCTQAVEDTDTFTANTTVYSDWEIKKHTVKFVNAAGNEVSSAEYDYGTAASAITKPANTAMTKDANKHYSYSWPTISDVTADVIYKEVVTSADHTWNSGTVTTEPTCTSEGVKTYTCTFEGCGATYTEDVDALGHDYKAVDTPPTCTEKGYTTYTCSVCSDSYTADETEMVAHTAGTTVVENEKAATCTATGSYDNVVYCTECNAEMSRETVTTDMIAHTAGATVVENEKAATCTATGSYDNVVYCTECNAEMSRDTVITDMIAHDYKAVVTPPTCTEKGYTTYTCSRCTDSYVDDYVDALGHTWNSGEITTEPTCTDKGVKTYTCTFEGCGATYTEDVDALGHDIKNHEAKAPTCTEIGWDAYDTCSRCDYTTYKEIAALGHIDENPVDGYCDREDCQADICKHPDYNLKVDEPTCTQDGMAHKICKVCKAELSTTVIPAKGHSEVITEVGATCQEYAHNLVTCANCDGLNEKVYTGNYFAPHSWVIIPGKAPTCTSEGYSDYSRCMTCATIEESSKIPVVPHTDSDNNEVCDTCGGKYISSSKACGCICHNDNFIMVILYKIAHFFWKLFKINKSCKCGTVHY